MSGADLAAASPGGTSGHGSGDMVEAARRLLGAEARPAEGGYSGETYLVGLPGEEAVLRLYLRRPDRAPADALLLRLVRGLVPVPRVLELREAAAGGPAYLLAERLPGVRLDLFLSGERDAELLAAAGRDVGRVLGRLSGVPFLHAGEFVGPELAVRPFPAHATGLAEWLATHRRRGRLAAWTDAEIGRLCEVADRAQALLDTHRRVCLCHGDANPKNVLVDPATGAVTGLVDWEYAYAGTPHADLGNMLRFETVEPFCRSVLAGYAELVPAPGGTVLELGRAADLFALVELAARDRVTRVVDLANIILRATASAGDLAAGRPEWAPPGCRAPDGAGRRTGGAALS